MAKKPDTRSEDVKRITRSKLYKEIEKDLRDQLEANGTFGKFFDDMISDYMAMYVTKTLLVEDIQNRGHVQQDECTNVETSFGTGIESQCRDRWWRLWRRIIEIYQNLPTI